MAALQSSPAPLDTTIVDPNEFTEPAQSAGHPPDIEALFQQTTQRFSQLLETLQHADNDDGSNFLAVLQGMQPHVLNEKISQILEISQGLSEEEQLEMNRGRELNIFGMPPESVPAHASDNAAFTPPRSPGQSHAHSPQRQQQQQSSSHGERTPQRHPLQQLGSSTSMEDVAADDDRPSFDGEEDEIDFDDDEDEQMLDGETGATSGAGAGAGASPTIGSSASPGP